MEPRDARTLTATELRHRIDRGETGDKVAGFDPAAAPLGTDEEAAGTTPAQHALPETVGRPQAGLTPAPRDSIAPDADPAKPRGMAWWGLGSALGAIACAALIWLLWR
ncbi:MAG TPA: hypothetical protein VKY24_12295 [Reyranella sp.]|jgi:hypothetical protein|nr:hypothetical protein [Reyranella sp.]